MSVFPVSISARILVPLITVLNILPPRQIHAHCSCVIATLKSDLNKFKFSQTQPYKEKKIKTIERKEEK